MRDTKQRIWRIQTKKLRKNEKRGMATWGIPNWKMIKWGIANTKYEQQQMARWETENNKMEHRGITKVENGKWELGNNKKQMLDNKWK